MVISFKLFFRDSIVGDRNTLFLTGTDRVSRAFCSLSLVYSFHRPRQGPPPLYLSAGTYPLTHVLLYIYFLLLQFIFNAFYAHKLGFENWFTTRRF